MRGCQKSLRITLSPVTVHSSHSAQCKATVHSSQSAPKSKSQCTQVTLHNHSAQRIQVSVTIHGQLSHSAECIVIFIVQSCHSHTPVCLAGTETSCNVQCTPTGAYRCRVQEKQGRFLAGCVHLQCVHFCSVSSALSSAVCFSVHHSTAFSVLQCISKLR